jgi:glucosamine--fructose-6-phosphate aminotransferase (isomerizing)
MRGDDGRRPEELARSFALTGRMLVVGRGVEYATARELALKLAETCRVGTAALTTTDLAHGPIAALDAQFPVLAIASRDDALPAVLSGLDRARRAGATVISFGNAAGLVRGTAGSAPVPCVPLPVLSPLLSIVPGQLFADALARVRGLDPDLPPSLTKVTLAP